MNGHCDRCPCPTSCLRWPAFCEWAAEDPPDAVKLRHIRERSALGESPPAVRVEGLSHPPSAPVDYAIPDRPAGKCCGQ